MNNWPFKVIKKDPGNPYIQATFNGETKDFAPEEISAMILRKMKEDAERFLGKPVNRAVISGTFIYNKKKKNT